MELVNGETKKPSRKRRHRRRSEGAMAEQNPGGGGRGNDGAMAAQNPGGGGRGSSIGGVQYPGRGGGERFIEGEAEIPEFLPPNETLGGYIFMCNVHTLPGITELNIFGYPVAFRDRVEAITPGLPLFLYNLSTRRLHGIYEAAGNGGYNIEPRFCPVFADLSRSSFPAQVRVRMRREYQPLDEQMTTGIMENLRIPHNNYYKYRVELSVPEAANIINVFAENGVAVV